MKPNFLFIGPDKSGSSWLFRTLTTHPEVHLSPAKDLYFFDRYYDRGPEWYFSRFNGAKEGTTVVGEVCHDYLYSYEAPQRILETLGPETRILTCLREPVDRAFSDHLNRMRSGTDAGDTFRETLEQHPEIVAAGRYSSYVRRYLDVFGPRQVKIAVFDDLVADPQRFLNEITTWLGISALDLSTKQAEPARPAATSRAVAVTRLARRGAALARAIGLESFVGRVKSSRRVEAALYRPFNEKPKPCPDDVLFVRSQVADDVATLSDLTKIPFDEIWTYRP